MVLLNADKGVSRMALSKPPQVLNDVARSITQSSGTTEPYSIAGLNGKGIVVGIAELVQLEMILVYCPCFLRYS